MDGLELNILYFATGKDLREIDWVQDHRYYMMSGLLHALDFTCSERQGLPSSYAKRSSVTCTVIYKDTIVRTRQFPETSRLYDKFRRRNVY